jgi:hypothetical protein
VDKAPRLLLDVEEVGALLGVSRSRDFRLIGSGELESIGIGSLRKIPEGSNGCAGWQAARRIAARQ